MRTEDDNHRHLDCPGCPECTLPCGTTVDAPAGLLRCAACGHTWTPGPNELAQAKAADAATLDDLLPSLDDALTQARRSLLLLRIGARRALLDIDSDDLTTVALRSRFEDAETAIAELLQARHMHRLAAKMRKAVDEGASS